MLDVADPSKALFTAQNLITVGAMRVLQARGWKHRVALIGTGLILEKPRLRIPQAGFRRPDPRRLSCGASIRHAVSRPVTAWANTTARTGPPCPASRM